MGAINLVAYPFFVAGFGIFVMLWMTQRLSEKRSPRLSAGGDSIHHSDDPP